jgi:hypothetical protein
MMTDDQPRAERTRRRCTATCTDGSPCRAWAVRTSDPPRCSPHGGGRLPAGAPRGNQNARTHGFYAQANLLAETDLPAVRAYAEAQLDAQIARSCVRQFRLARYIGQNKHQLPLPRLVRCCKLYNKNLNRLVSMVEVRYGHKVRSKAEATMIAIRLLRAHTPSEEDDP